MKTTFKIVLISLVTIVFANTLAKRSAMAAKILGGI